MRPPGRRKRWFGDCFAGSPGECGRAPGRANLIGEHTDYNQGWVLPFALDPGVTVAAGRRDDGRAGHLLAPGSRRPGRAAGRLPRSRRRHRLGGLPGRVAWALREAGHRLAGGAGLAVDSDLPQGAGLSSSAALECATALALAELYRLDLPRPELATLAWRAENDFVGVPSGIMDQSASLLSEAGHALLLDCRSGETAAVPLDPAGTGLALTIIDTGARHDLGDGRYAQRRSECDRAASLLGVGSLRDVTSLAALAGLADPVLRRRARHVITENGRVKETVAPALRRRHGGSRRGAARVTRFAPDDFEVSWPEADVAVDAAEAAGALGARMMGGGFGGSALALVPAGSGRSARPLQRSFSRRGWPPPVFLQAIPSAGARRCGEERHGAKTPADPRAPATWATAQKEVDHGRA
jgi:galactokinase